MKVLKFGGTSLANTDRFIEAANIIEQAHTNDQVAAVLSAPAKITNYLVAIVDKSIANEDIKNDFDEAFYIFEHLIIGLKKANPNFDDKTIRNFIQTELSDILKIAKKAQEKTACEDPIAASVHSRGEKLSIALMKTWFEAKGYEVTLIDPVKKLLAYGEYLESSVDLKESFKRIDYQSIPKDHIILMPGFTAGNEKGELVLLGRNGSDYSAACLAYCLNANKCQIWTDVDGVYTCDPRLVSDAICLKSMSYKEAMELSYFGAKVIHPRTIAPLVHKNIPCIIKNTQNPQGQGTSISEHSNDDLMIKGITNFDNVVMLSVAGSAMKGVVGMAARVFKTMSDANISVMLITQSSSEYSISFCVAGKDHKKALTALNNSFEKELTNGSLDPIDVKTDLSIISVVGDGMRQAKGVAAKFFKALGNVNISIIAIAQGSSERSISAVIPKNKAISAIKSTHQMLFSKKKIINVFLVGVGGVGTKLIEQIISQKDYLATKDIEIRICCLANSNKMILDAEGLSLEHWENWTDFATQISDFELMLSFIKVHHIVNPVFVDCTTANSIASLYSRALKEGFHVVTPNKKANTGDFAYYQEMRENARLNSHKFLYETNVGAGLPVIENLQNLLVAGDEVYSFEGILSGSLSFILGEMDNGVSFSKATKIAKHKGFTEPHPAADLSGEDVARKLLILAREIGLQLELDDIEVESLLPNDFVISDDSQQFLQDIENLDSYYQKLIVKTQQEGKVLRYIGAIDNGKCSVGIKAVNKDNPLFNVKNGENALAFYTRYYSPIPLLLRGYGAGNEVTAAGIFADILRTLSSGEN